MLGFYPYILIESTTDSEHNPLSPIENAKIDSVSGSLIHPLSESYG